MPIEWRRSSTDNRQRTVWHPSASSVPPSRSYRTIHTNRPYYGTPIPGQVSLLFCRSLGRLVFCQASTTRTASLSASRASLSCVCIPQERRSTRWYVNAFRKCLLIVLFKCSSRQLSVSFKQTLRQTRTRRHATRGERRGACHKS